MPRKLNNLLQADNELAELQKLLKQTQKQVDDAVEQGNNALLDLKDEFDELAEKKRDLLRDIESLEDRYKKLEKKIGYAENIYGKYLNDIKEKDV